MKTEKSRITIMIDKKLESKVREIQANMIKKTQKGISFSYVVSQLLIKSLKKV